MRGKDVGLREDGISLEMSLEGGKDERAGGSSRAGRGNHADGGKDGRQQRIGQAELDQERDDSRRLVCYIECQQSTYPMY